MSDYAATPSNEGMNDLGHKQAPTSPAPLRPSWLYPALTAFVIAVHAAYFLSGIYWPPPTIVPIDAINAELLPEGDSLEAGELAPEGDSLDGARSADSAKDAAAPEEESVPPPAQAQDMIAAEPAPKKKKAAEKAKAAEKKVDKKKVAAMPATPRRAGETVDGKRGDLRYGLPGGKGAGVGTSRIGGRFGVPGGKGQGSAATQASCLAAVAGSIRRHTPAYTSLGPGVVYVTFYVNSGGGVSGVSASGGSAAHAALAKRIVASSRGPASCAAAFASQSITFQ